MCLHSGGLFIVLLCICTLYLGKTIQTIALLAHLVCEKNIWGPHLIIVPTSVLLNWENELKKWCPALKILTYFGSLKERKQKRMVSHMCVIIDTLEVVILFMLYTQHFRAALG